MTVYVLMYAFWDSWEVAGVFSTLGAAMEAVPGTEWPGLPTDDCEDWSAQGQPYEIIRCVLDIPPSDD